MGSPNEMVYIVDDDPTVCDALSSLLPANGKVICCKPQERFNDHKLAYYINMGYPIRADHYDLDSREAMTGLC
jgi:hypothetical protein